MRRQKREPDQSSVLKPVEVEEVTVAGVLLTPDEMAEILRVPRSWLYGLSRKRGKGSIPLLKVGKYLRFRESEVLAWLDSRQNRGMKL